MHPAAVFVASYIGLWGILLIVVGIASILPPDVRVVVGSACAILVVFSPIAIMAWAVSKAPG